MKQVALFFWLVIVTCGLGWYVDYLAHDELTTAARWLIAGVTLAGIFTLIASIATFTFVMIERVRVARAQRLQIQRDAQLQIVIAAPGSQVYASEVEGSLTFRHKPLHLAPGTVNGAAYEPNTIELQKWLAFQQLQSINHAGKVEVNQLTDGQQTLPEHVDLNHYISGGSSLRSIFLGVGRFADGRIQPVSAPLERLVHIGTGGAPGFGKSFFMQSIAYQALNAREAPQVALLDTQGTSFTAFLGHDRILYYGNEVSLIALILAELVGEMTRRQQLMGQWRGVQNLKQYNQAVSEAQRLNPLVVLFDEFGMAHGNKTVVKNSLELSHGGRKTGISLIVGTQHWAHNDVSTSFRGDLSTRIQFFTRDKSDSRILLGNSAAVNITRPGQAFAVLPGVPDLIEMQGPDPSSVIDVTPELLPAGVADSLAGLKDRLDGDEEETAANEDAYFVELVQSGLSRGEASRRAYGRDYAGNLVSRGKRALGEI